MKTLVLALLTVGVVLGNVPEVILKYGIIKGVYQQTTKGRTISAFYGIPYAKPPVGELRFKPPIPTESWQGILDASKVSFECPQVDMFALELSVIGNEDCLYLNVYTPYLLNSTTGEALLVIFFVHGGGFRRGSSNPNFYGPNILLDKNVLLITINYRLGAAGFLSTEDEFLPGNYGLKDQAFALKWVKDNIAPFGGDPNKVTIIGQSSGGASVHYLMLSDLSKHLINGVISLSGISTARWALAAEGEAVKNTKKLASYLNCSCEDIPEMVKCLKGADIYNIIKESQKLNVWSYHPMIPFKPVIEPKMEGAFLTDNPIDIIKAGRAANVPLIIGVDLQDGALITATLYNNSTLIKELNDDFEELLPMILFFEDNVDKINISKKIRKFYFGEKTIDNLTKSEVTNLFTDVLFLYPGNAAARLHAKFTTHPVYYLMFGFRGTLSLSMIFGNTTEDFGVYHGDELIYLFSSDVFPNYHPSKLDLKMNDVMTTLLENFAKTGNPTSRIDSVIATEWQPVQANTSMSYYFIKNYNDIEMVDDIYKNRAEFWRSMNLNAHFTKINNEL